MARLGRARHDAARFGSATQQPSVQPEPGAFFMAQATLMPRHRPPPEIWQVLRWQVWRRDRGLCQGPYCGGQPPLPLDGCQVDHRRSGKLAGNALANLRVLCRRCHTLRLDARHRGMVAGALKAGLIPPDWRRFVWAEDLWPDEQTIAENQRWLARS